jgi:hypothetical protein
MSVEILNELFPEYDNTPSNYRLKRDPNTDLITVYYIPDNQMLIFFDAYALERQVIDFLIASGVDIEEGAFGSPL